MHPCRSAPSSPLDVFVGGSGVGCALFALHFLFCTPTTTAISEPHRQTRRLRLGCTCTVRLRPAGSCTISLCSACIVASSSFLDRDKRWRSSPRHRDWRAVRGPPAVYVCAPHRSAGVADLDRRWSLRSSSFVPSLSPSLSLSHASTHRCWPCPIEPSSRVAWQSVKAAVRETHPCMDGAPCLASLLLSTLGRRGYLRRTRLDIR